MKGLRIALEIVTTGIAAPLFIVLLMRAHLARFLVLMASPVLWPGVFITRLINRAFPPDRSTWFPGLGTLIVVEFVLTWIWIWFLMIVALKLIEKFVKRRREQE